MKSGDIQFLAGVIEGGCYIGILDTKHVFIPVLRIRRSRREILDKIHSLYPGWPPRKTTKHGKVTYWLNYQGKRVYELLRLVRPYLVGKLDHAEKIFEFETLVERHKAQNGTHVKLTDEEKGKRRLCCIALRGLNVDYALRPAPVIRTWKPAPEPKVDDGSEEEVKNLFDIE